MREYRYSRGINASLGAYGMQIMYRLLQEIDADKRSARIGQAGIGDVGPTSEFGADSEALFFCFGPRPASSSVPSG
jgi:hypothetical protein